jgi:hypothetical protein
VPGLPSWLGPRRPRGASLLPRLKHPLANPPTHSTTHPPTHPPTPHPQVHRPTHFLEFATLEDNDAGVDVENHFS